MPMQLLLWRHAEAFDGSPDMSRSLTPKGHRQAREIARWLAPRLPSSTRILVSPATRTVETATALSNDFELAPALAPGAGPEELLAAAGWPGEGETAVLIVGHQPTLGLAASLVLTGEAHPWRVRKGGLWWFRAAAKDSFGGPSVRAVMNPDLLRDPAD